MEVVTLSLKCRTILTGNYIIIIIIIIITTIITITIIITTIIIITIIITIIIITIIIIEQHSRKPRSQRTTENSHIGHCTHTSESTRAIRKSTSGRLLKKTRKKEKYFIRYKS
jgi:positive regulator of sigma E activity